MNVDVEALLIPWIASQLGVRAVTDLPANLGDVLPVVQVVRVSGADDINSPSLDSPIVDVDCYGVDRAAASLLARQAHEAIRNSLVPLTVDGATVTRTRTVLGPSWRPYDDISLRRFGATYQITVKSRP